MNNYMQELVDRIDNNYSTDTKDMSMGDWICANTHLRGRPFSFERYPFQKAIADDQHPNMDVIKVSQIGLTEVQIRKALGFLQRNRGTSLIFTLPNDDMFKRISTPRILPIAKGEKVFNLGDEKPVRSQSLIQVGSSFMYVTGAKETDATSISADVVFNDEIDLTDQKMLALFNSRLQNSDFKINQRFSTPTFHGFGVDLGFQASDQHEFMAQCDSCNHWNIPTFDKKFIEIDGLPEDTPLLEISNDLIDTGLLDLRNASVVCEKCRCPLDLARVEKREWVPRFPSRTHHRGYRVSPFSTSRLGVEYIVSQMLQYRARDFMRGFNNTVLGLADSSGTARLSEADIMRCFTPQQVPPEGDLRMPTWVGIDVGKICHMIVSQGTDLTKQHVILFKSFPVEKLEEETEIILHKYNVIGGACDRHPYTPTADLLYETSKGKILPVEYRGQKDVNLVKDPLTDKISHGQVNRTTMIDEFVKMVRLSRVQFSGYGDQRQVVIDHLKDMVRDETPDTPARWVKLTGNDHYFHAGAFLSAAIRMKALELGLFSEPRATVLLSGVPKSSDTGLPFNINKNRPNTLL